MPSCLSERECGNYFWQQFVSLTQINSNTGNGGFTPIVCDVTNFETICNLDVLGEIDMLVNNAGVSRLAPFLETRIEDWDLILNTNLRSAFLISQIVAKGMVSRGCRGSIVNVSSVASLTGLKDHVAYCVSKGVSFVGLALGEMGWRVSTNIKFVQRWDGSTYSYNGIRAGTVWDTSEQCEPNSGHDCDGDRSVG
eukprot:TRINITY_DN551_c0_g1_i6.p1 TRINITY_DN551_c0_g1~~TRINITY_DN551_c0_g1_i6.p1  ORF type:complete len:195 (+),score=22.21 TRINITY_DN551_c0_g1_i6:226-810(+)